MHRPAVRRRVWRRRNLVFFLAGLVVALGVGLGGWHRLAPVASIDRALFDTLLVMHPIQTPADATVVVDIDDVSLEAVGQWPWPRYRIAALLERIAAAQPAAIGMDILFAEPDRTSLSQLQQAFQRDFGLDLAFDQVPAGLQDNDGYLGHVMGRADVVGARYFYFDHTSQRTAPLRPGVGFDGQIERLALNRAPGVLDSVPVVAGQTRLHGFVNSSPDTDGVLRRLPLLIQHEGVVHASLALATTMRALGVTQGSIEGGRDGVSLRVGSHSIPIDRAGYALLRFHGPASRYAAVSAVDVLSGQVAPEALRGKVVFVGTSSVGLDDIHPTAVDPRFPGLKIHAAMTQGLLDDQVIRTPDWAGGFALGSSVLAGALFLLVAIAGAAGGVVVLTAAGMAALLLAGGGWAFSQVGWFVPVGAPLLTLGVLLVLTFAVRFILAQHHARRWRLQLENARQLTIESMAAVAETRDPETGAHIKRTQAYVRAIAEQLQRSGHHTTLLTRPYIHLLFLSAPLHDIGKVGVPDHILLKPGRLTPEEMEVMKRHADFGRQIIESMEERIEGDNFLSIAAEIAATHHEKWDGTGYPLGLAGDDIPLSGRIMSVADVYDALISRRCYKPAFTHEHATSIMREMRASAFDPVVLDAFFAIEADIVAIAARFRDEDAPSKVVEA